MLAKYNVYNRLERWTKKPRSKKPFKVPDLLDYSGLIVSTDSEKAELFNELFIEKVQLSGAPGEPPAVASPVACGKDLLKFKITRSQVKTALRNISPHKASGGG